MRPELSLDRLAAVNANRVGPAAISLIDSLQRFTSEEQAVGFGLAFLLLCRRLKAHPGNVLQVAQRVLDDCGHKQPELKAALMYMENEIV